MTRIVDRFPLTPIQEGMLFNALLAPDSGIDVLQVVCELPERIDVGRLNNAWRGVAERHSMLRTAFRWTDVAKPVQEVYDAAAIELTVLDHRGASPSEAAARLDEFLAVDRRRGRSLAARPTIRLALVRGQEDHTSVVWTVHHAFVDARSMARVLEEVFERYDSGGTGGRPPSRPFRDFADWLAMRAADSDEAFWRDSLGGFESPTPLPEHANASPIAAEGGAHGECMRRVAARTTAALRAQALDAGVHLNTLVTAAWAFVLGRLSGEDDVVFGLVRGLHVRAFPGAETIVGPLLNTVPVRVRLRPEQSLSRWLREVRAATLRLQGREHTALTAIQGWSDVPRGMPLFQSLVNYQAATVEAWLRSRPGRWAERSVWIRRKPNVPLALAAYAEDSLLLRLDFARSQFSDAAAERILDLVVRFLVSLRETAARPLAAAPLFSGAERRRLVHEWNRTHRAMPAVCVHEMFEERASRSPDAVAIRAGSEALTYRELDRRADGIAGYLCGRGIGPEKRVALYIAEGPDAIAALLGVLKAGGAYVPLDTGLPRARLATILSDCRPDLILADARGCRTLEGSGHEVVGVEALENTAGWSGRRVSSAVATGNAAYVLYTSGSTGRPKGVVVEHGGVCNMVRYFARLYALKRGDRSLLLAPLHFDASVAEVFTALWAGATLHVPGSPWLLTGEELVQRLQEERITHAKFTPSALAVLPDAALPSLKTLVVGGEPCSAELVARWRGNRRFINVYGPTEATVRVTAHACKVEPAAPPLGKPIANTRLYVLDRWQCLLPTGAAGELYIGGTPVARGYLVQAGMTAERFVPDPFGSDTGARLYRTGDRVRWRDDGMLEYLGRLDKQVKIRGVRVEPGEIETAVRRHAGVRECVVESREVESGEQRLVAYFLGEVEVEALKARLREMLPGYMVPSAFVRLDRVPRTPSGKLDRNALPMPGRPSTGGRSVGPRNAVEGRLAALWAEALKLERVGVHENFFELGGHSLVATGLASRVREAFDIDVGVRMFFERPTIADFAEWLLERPEHTSGAAARPAAVPSSDQHLLTIVDQLTEEELDHLLRRHVSGGTA